VIDRDRVHEGMVVRSSDGKKLGRVRARKKGTFVVEKGFFFATDYVAHYEDVSEIAGGEIRLSRPQTGLAHEEHAVAHEGGLGESLALDAGAGLDTSRGEPWARAEEEEEEACRRSVRGDEEETGPGYSMGGRHHSTPLTYGDEGGGGLL
jgi:hypothetical protein